MASCGHLLLEVLNLVVFLSDFLAESVLLPLGLRDLILVVLTVILGVIELL